METLNSDARVSNNSPILLFDIPEKNENKTDVLVLKNRISKAWELYLENIEEKDTGLYISSDARYTSANSNGSNGNGAKPNSNKANSSTDERAKQYKSQKPSFQMEQLIVPESVIKDLKIAIQITNLRKKVFEEWGLNKIQPFPYSALNFYGEPGTGKSMAAHAIASFLGKEIILASYAQIESMYHGEGPKNVEALFYAAERDNAVLFIDESDSLLSKRLTNVTQGSEQAINSMRSQLLICLERFQGIVIFATNLIDNYDSAFETRVRNICFPMPDASCRKKIWEAHLVESLPVENELDTEHLATVEDVCGRDIRNAVIDAALETAMEQDDIVSTQRLKDAILRVKSRRVNSQSPETTKISLSDSDSDIVQEEISKLQRDT